METTVTPATKVCVTDWISLTITRNVQIQGGALVPAPMVNLTTQVRSYLGDSNGAPVQALPDSNAPGTWNSLSLDLSEEVTRADGSKMTIWEILDGLALAAANLGPP